MKTTQQLKDSLIYQVSPTARKIIDERLMNEKCEWKVGDRVRLAGVEGKVTGVSARIIDVFWNDGGEGNSFYIGGAIAAKLERVAEPPKPLPELECLSYKSGNASSIFMYLIKTFWYQPAEIIPMMERDISKLREYLGEAAPAPEKREIIWPTEDEFLNAKNAANISAFCGPVLYSQWIVRWFREQIEGQL